MSALGESAPGDSRASGARRARHSRRATAPATRDGEPIIAETVISPTRDDVPEVEPEAARTQWLREQRPPHWGTD